MNERITIQGVDVEILFFDNGWYYRFTVAGNEWFAGGHKTKPEIVDRARGTVKTALSFQADKAKREVARAKRAAKKAAKAATI